MAPPYKLRRVAKIGPPCDDAPQKEGHTPFLQKEKEGSRSFVTPPELYREPMWIAVALCAVVFWLAIFFTFFQSNEEALQALLPKHAGESPELGVWIRCRENPDGSYYEERFLLEGRWLFRQVRKRNAAGEIVEVLPEERVR